MNMPAIVKAYFDAEERTDPDALAALFAADAVVRDEGARHVGPAAIRTWWMAAKARYAHVAKPVGTTVNGDTIAVRATVSGNFPNSPATLDFTFTVTGGKVATLEIG